MKKTTLTLFKMNNCPYCMKTMKEIKRLKINVDYKDINESEKHNKTLIQEGGKRQVPCLRISNNNTASIWLYESDAIIDYLKEFSLSQ